MGEKTLIICGVLDVTRMNCLEVQMELIAGVILLNIFWPLMILNTEEH